MSDEWTRAVKLFVRIGVTFTVLIVSFYIILSNAYPDSHAKWAFGMVGLVLGYWLR